MMAAASTLLERRAGRFHDAWETRAESSRRREIRDRLREYVGYARRLPFYRRRLKGFDPDSPHPLAAVPVLSARELREGLPPASRALVAGGGAFNVFQSGGTTGNPKTTLFSHAELEGLTLPNARGFYAVGLRKTDRVANLFAVGGLYMTFLHIHRMLQEYGCMNFPFSNQTPPDFVHSVVRLFNVNCVAGITSAALSCLRSLERLGLGGIRIEKLYYGGEHMYEADKREARERFGTRVIAAPGYGTVDTWYIGYQCLDCPTGVFHAHDDQCFIEIVDGDGGTACEPANGNGEAPAGMLYATPFARRLTPVVRYCVGDRARWVAGPCPCGRTTPRFMLLGRGDDVLRIGFDSVDYAYVQEAVTRVGGLSGAAQMEKRREGGKDRLVIRVETDAAPSERKRLAQALEHEVVSKRPSLRKFIAEGTVWPLQVLLLDPGRLARNARTGKLRRVIDVEPAAGPAPGLGGRGKA